MCGRFTLTVSPEALAEEFGLAETPELEPRYNIAPSQPVAVVRYGRTLGLVRWGLIPGWAKDASIGNKLINARAESAGEKPAFRSAFRRRRCLVVADGFYEWQAARDRKQPIWFHLAGGRPFAFAGLWERWHDPAGDRDVDSCTILTVPASPFVAPVHDRMPAILTPGDYDAWLDPALEDTARLHAMLRPYAGEDLQASPANPLVNSPAHEGPECLLAP
jgi:putative SOS response-associated peptidase YedK